MGDLRQDLEALAMLHGVELSYYDIRGRHYVASDEALLALLPNLGAPLEGPGDIHEALRARQQEIAHRVLEPVVVVWDDAPHFVPLRIPALRKTGRYRIEVLLENGTVRGVEGRLDDLDVHDDWEVEGTHHLVVHLPLGRALPLGYHHVRVAFGSTVQEALLMSAPRHAWLPTKDRMWGVFAPAYALNDDRSMGAGGLRELSRLVRWVGEAGGDFVGTLPLMSAFLDEPFEPSPYAPVSRLFWNELFVDIARLPELARDESARRRLEGPEISSVAQTLNRNPHVDYRAQAELQRRVLSSLAETAFSGSSRAELERFAAGHPRARDYAMFRATTESRREPWHSWPAPLRDGDLTEVDFEPQAYRYHLYVQLRMQQQLGALSNEVRQLGGGLYLDMPLGVHPDGYDAWRERGAFLADTSAGAPPDDLFVGGQDWGFRPLHPERIRFRRYEYVIACIRHQLSCAGALRIDHVMGLHRIFCIPKGMGGENGVYVHYRPAELYAILNIESHRHESFLVGEDLGTVPNAVRNAMDEHHFHRMYVAQFSLRGDPNHAVVDPPKTAAASINTHDTPTFAAFWEGHDIDDRLSLNHLSEPEAPKEREDRAALRHTVIQYLQNKGLLTEPPTTDAVFRTLVRLLGASEARLVLVNLEDLWGERRPQNVPGTTIESPNWRRRAARSIEQILSDAGLTAVLHQLDRSRRNGDG